MKPGDMLPKRVNIFEVSYKCGGSLKVDTEPVVAETKEDALEKFYQFKTSDESKRDYYHIQDVVQILQSVIS